MAWNCPQVLCVCSQIDWQIKFINLWLYPCTLSTANVARKKVRNYDRRFYSQLLVSSCPDQLMGTWVEISGMEIKLDLYVIIGIRGSEQPLLHVTTVPGPIALLSVKVMTFFHLLCTVIPLPLNVSKPENLYTPRSTGICGRPRVSSRGPLNLHGNSFLDGDEVQFSCIANYDLFGSQKSRCVGRRWNAGIPECKGRLFLSYSLHFGRILAHRLSFTLMLFLSSKEMKDGDEGERENVICNLDYVNVETWVLMSRRILNF